MILILYFAGMEMESTYSSIDLLSKFITEKIDEMSLLELETLKGNPVQCEKFILENLQGEILLNNLKKDIVPEVDFYSRKAFLIKIETYMFKLYSKRLSEWVASL